MIKKEEVEKVAKLARLKLTDEEVLKMQKDLSSILDYFNLLKKAPKPQEAGQEILLRSDIESVRKDDVKQSNASLAERLIVAAPEKKERYIKVRTILD